MTCTNFKGPFPRRRNVRLGKGLLRPVSNKVTRGGCRLTAWNKARIKITHWPNCEWWKTKEKKKRKENENKKAPSQSREGAFCLPAGGYVSRVRRRTSSAMVS